MTAAAAYVHDRRFIYTHYLAAQDFVSWSPCSKYDIISNIWLHQSICIYSRNWSDKFHL